MASINKVILIGTVGQDPEVKYAASGTKILKFSLATSDSKKVGDTWEQETEWHKIVVFGKSADYCENKVCKGVQLYIEGKIKSNKWTDENNQKKSSTSIIANDIKVLSKSEHSNTQQSANDSFANSSENYEGRVDEEDNNDLPF